jgi:hypothetical protein
MGIDGIGKGGVSPPASGIDGAKSPSATEIGSPSTEFKVGKATASDAPAAASLDLVRSGAISVSQYLDVKVNEATAHLADRLSADQFSFVRRNLREQLSADPALIDLVKAATGKLPPPNE